MRKLVQLKIHFFWVFPAAILLLLAQSKPFTLFLLAHPETFTFQSVVQCARHLADFGFVAILFSGFFYWGRKILNQFGFPAEQMHKMESFLFACLIGEAATAYGLLLLGLMGWFNIWTFRTVFLAFLYGSVKQRKKIWFMILHLKNFLSEKVTPPHFFCFCLIAAALMRGVVATAAPPTDWDSISYHLALPKIFLNAQKVFRIPWCMNAHFPLNTEMIYAMALSLKSDLAAQWINFAHGILFLSLIAWIAARYFSTTIAVGALLLLILQPIFQNVFGNAASDFSVASASGLAFLAFLKKEEAGELKIAKRWSLLSGCCCGIAMSCKFSGALSAVTLFILIAASFLQKICLNPRDFENPREAASARVLPIRSWLPLLYFLAGTVCLGIPWYLKNFLWTGNPIWPLWGELFRASSIDMESWHRVQSAVTEGVEKNFTNWFLLPALMVALPELFRYAPHYLFAPFFLILIFRICSKKPLATASLPSSGQAKKMLWMTGVFGSLWFWLLPQTARYLLPIAGWVAILLSLWSVELFKQGGVVRVVPLVLFFSIVPLKDLTISNEAFAFLGLKSLSAPDSSAREHYLELTLGDWYKICRASNEILPPSAKLLFFRDTRGYYLEREYAWGDPLNPGVFSYSKIADAKNLRQTLLHLGFTHILYNPFIGGYRGDQNYYRRTMRMMQELLQKYASPILTIRGHTLYELKSEARGQRSE